MNVVGHQDRGMNRNHRLVGHTREVLEKAAPIIVGEEDRRSIDAAQDHMQWVTGDNNAGPSRHRPSLG
jgi:hypothetical protein